MKVRERALFFVVVTALAVGICLASCSKSDEENLAASGKETPKGELSVYTVNYPLAYFAERIGRMMVRIEFPAPPDEDPAYWMPDPETVGEFQEADLILLNGAKYAKWIDKVSLPEEKLFNTSEAFSNQLIALEDAMTHSHGPEGEHEHTGWAFTTWLDPKLAVEQARAIQQKLTELRPDREKVFQEWFSELEQDLLDLDKSIGEVVAGKEDTPLVMSHPVYQYLERRFGLNAKSVHWEPDTMPDATMWKELEDLLAEHPAKWMIWEGVPSDEVVQKLKGMGIESTVFAPCGNVPERGDFLDVMRQNVKNLEIVFQK
jgi:zinc transport system substrate-binding protein